MISNFGVYGRCTPWKCRGVPHIGSIVLKLKVSVTPGQKFHWESRLGLHHLLFLRGFATNFTGVWNAMDAPINIPVTNVTCHIQPTAVIFDPFRLPVPKEPPPGPELPTPVQIERLIPLLHGYDAELVHALYNGFKVWVSSSFSRTPSFF
jgi:hypothetical protein